VAFGPLSQSRGGTPIDGRLAIQARPCPKARLNTNYVCRRFASDVFSFVLSVRHCRAEAALAQCFPPALVGVTSAWTTGIGVQRTPFCERLCPVVTNKLMREENLVPRRGFEPPPIE
jgi:hypothetical protein